jgi:hypothetical protein
MEVLRWIVLVALTTLLLYTLLIWSAYLRSPFFIDQAEASVAMQALAFADGRPLYHSLDSADRTSMLYGPVPYFVHRVFVRTMRDPILATKSAGVLMSLLSLVLIARALWNARAATQTACLLVYVLICYFCFSNVSYWNRPDSFVLAGVRSQPGQPHLRSHEGKNLVSPSLFTTLQLPG